MIHILVVVVINLIMVATAAIMEFVISAFYLGAEPSRDRTTWLINASFRFCVSLAVALLCSWMQYAVNRDAFNRMGADKPLLLKKISYISFAVLAVIGLYFSIRFFLEYEAYWG